jgi:hypothetical protein
MTSAGAITGGSLELGSGDITNAGAVGCDSVTASGVVSGDSLTLATGGIDSVGAITGSSLELGNGDITNAGAVTASGVITGASLTLDFASIDGTGKLTCNNLEVSGTTTTVNTTNLEVTDNIITLNKNGGGWATGTSGIEVENSSGATQLIFNKSTGAWQTIVDGAAARNIAYDDATAVHTQSANLVLDHDKTFTIEDSSDLTAGTIQWADGSKSFEITSTGSLLTGKTFEYANAALDSHTTASTFTFSASSKGYIEIQTTTAGGDYHVVTAFYNGSGNLDIERIFTSIADLGTGWNEVSVAGTVVTVPNPTAGDYKTVVRVTCADGSVASFTASA